MTDYKCKNIPGHNFVLFQWLVVDGGAMNNSLSLSRQTRPTPSDSPPFKITHVRYSQFNNMKKYILISFVVLMTINYSSAQSVEATIGYSGSNQIRLQNLFGLGLKYSNRISPNTDIGFSVDYSVNKNTFSETESDDANPNNIFIYDYVTRAHVTSLRLDLITNYIQNDYIALGIGPDINLNFGVVKDNICSITCDSTNISSTHYYIHYSRLYFNRTDNFCKFGIALNNTIELKNIISKKLSIIFNIRPEWLISLEHMDGGYQPYQQNFLNIGFQIGIKYNFKNDK